MFYTAASIKISKSEKNVSAQKTEEASPRKTLFYVTPKFNVYLFSVVSHELAKSPYLYMTEE